MYRTTLLAIVVLTAVSCNQQEKQELQQAQPNASERTTVEMLHLTGVVARYEKGAMTDTLHNGEFVIYDACELALDGSLPNKQSRIVVYRVQMDDAPYAFLEKVGTRIRFDLDVDLLQEDVTIFAGGLEGVEVLGGKPEA